MKKFLSVFGLFLFLTGINYSLCSLLAWSFVTKEWKGQDILFVVAEMFIVVYTYYYSKEHQ